jgi:hypothetical protein
VLQLWSELDDVGNDSEEEGEEEEEDGSDGLAAFMKAFMVSAGFCCEGGRHGFIMNAGFACVACVGRCGQREVQPSLLMLLLLLEPPPPASLLLLLLSACCCYLPAAAAAAATAAASQGKFLGTQHSSQMHAILNSHLKAVDKSLK